MRKQNRSMQHLTDADLLAIEGIISKKIDEFKRLVSDHELTLFGPNRNNGLRTKVNELEERAQKTDRRWYKFVAIVLAVQILVNVAAFYIQHRYMIEQALPEKIPQISLDNRLPK